jgi:hypothetical protein
MREYSNFLLLEGVFDEISDNVLSIKNFSDLIFTPSMKVIEEDCGTTLGKIVETTHDISGRIETSTGEVITSDRVIQLLQAGSYTVFVRDLHHCTSEGGICQKDYVSSFPDYPVPEIGLYTKVPCLFLDEANSFLLDSSTTEFQLTREEGTYDSILVFKNGQLLPETEYSIANNLLTLVSPGPAGKYLTCKFRVDLKLPYLGYLAKTYSGAIFGMKGLTTQSIQVPEGAIKDSIDENILNIVTTDLSKLVPHCPANLVEYSRKIRDKLERALFIIAAYNIYTNVTV